ncbi:MAG: signal recognition particle protein, partial [Methylocystis sp.]
LMKSFGAGKRGGGMMGKAAQMMGLGPGMQMPSQEELQQLQAKLGVQQPKAPPGGISAAPPPDLLAKPSLPGLGGGLLSGLNPFGKKK